MIATPTASATWRGAEYAPVIDRDADGERAPMIGRDADGAEYALALERDADGERDLGAARGLRDEASRACA